MFVKMSSSILLKVFDKMFWIIGSLINFLELEIVLRNENIKRVCILLHQEGKNFDAPFKRKKKIENITMLSYCTVRSKDNNKMNKNMPSIFLRKRKIKSIFPLIFFSL